MNSLTQRENKLIRLLLQQNEYRPAGFFSERLSVSSKTIYKDIKNIEEYVYRFQLRIEKAPRKGIYLQGAPEEKERLKGFLQKDTTMVLEDEAFSPAHRQLIILTDLILREEKITYNKYAERFLVSPQSIKKDMDKVFQYLNNCGIQINAQAEEMLVLGKETEIQRVFKQYIEKRGLQLGSEFIIEPYMKEIIVHIDNFIEKIMQRTGKILNDNFSTSLKFSLFIFLNRLKKDRHVELQNDFIFQGIKKMQLYMTALDFSEEMNKALGCMFYKSDVQYLCSLLLAHGLEPEIVDKYVDEGIHQITTSLIAYISRLLNVDFRTDEQLYNSLISHIIPMVHRLRNEIFIRNPLKDSIKKQYATMFTLVQFGASVIEKKYHILLNEDELSFLTIYFQIAFEKIKPTKHILIVCGNGLAMSELIFNRIKQSLPAHVVVEIASEKQVLENSIEGIDLIIATVPLKIKRLPVLHISPLPTTEEISKIAAYLSNISENEKALVSQSVINPISLKDYIKKKFIFLNKNFETKEDVLNFLIDKYEEFDFVTESFKDSIYQREELGNTSIASGVAIPHALPETVKETVISFVTTKKPVTWGTNTVQLIVMIAIAEKDMDIAKDLISLLYDTIDSNEKVQLAVHSRTKNELVRIVNGGNVQEVFQ